MNLTEKYNGSKEEFYFFLKDEIIKLFKEKLKVDGTRVSIPDYEELDYQIKLDSNENYGNLIIEVSWGEKSEQLTDFEKYPHVTTIDKFLTL